MPDDVRQNVEMVLVAYPQFKTLLDEKDAEIARLSRLVAGHKEALKHLAEGVK